MRHAGIAVLIGGIALLVAAFLLPGRKGPLPASPPSPPTPAQGVADVPATGGASPSPAEEEKQDAA
ncbi:MAG: hypothetical protein ACREIU_09155, partial [Planctomycetota bacterium]